MDALTAIRSPHYAMKGVALAYIGLANSTGWRCAVLRRAQGPVATARGKNRISRCLEFRAGAGRRHHHLREVMDVFTHQNKRRGWP
jgi:hypothetical protein